MKLKDPFVKKEAPIRKASIFYNTVRCLITCGLNTCSMFYCTVQICGNFKLNELCNCYKSIKCYIIRVKRIKIL